MPTPPADDIATPRFQAAKSAAPALRSDSAERPRNRGGLCRTPHAHARVAQLSGTDKTNVEELFAIFAFGAAQKCKNLVESDLEKC